MPGGGRPGGGFGAGTPASSAAAAQAAQAIRAEPAFPPVVDPSSLPNAAAPASKRIVCEDDLRTFLDGSTVRAFVGFLLALNSSVVGLKLSQAAAAVPPAPDVPAVTAPIPGTTPSTNEPSSPVHTSGGDASTCSTAPAGGGQANASDSSSAIEKGAAVGSPAAPLEQQSLSTAASASSSAAHDRQAPPSPRGPSPGPSHAVDALCSALTEMSGWIDDFPPVTTELRFGNPSFRLWAARLVERAEGMIKRILPDQLQNMAVELAPYLSDSFGNASRIDYGTGHETTFAAFLYCLARLGVVTEANAAATVARVFAQYLTLVRRLQTTYWLEPAGSHGVWGLDDYQFLPFLWGSAQLVGHPMIRPKSIHNPDVLEAYSREYMYLACVDFVKTVKKGALGETSPMLNDISGVPNWDKVNRGMLKMYLVEVLSKFPIMQHFLFGSLMPLE